MMNRAEIIGLNKLSLPTQIKDDKIGTSLNTWCSGRREKLPGTVRLKAKISAHDLYLLVIFKFYFICKMCYRLPPIKMNPKCCKYSHPC